MQCRQLYRKPRAVDQFVFAAHRRMTGPGGDGLGRLLIAQGVTLGVVLGTRRLAQHVEGEAITLLGFVLGIGERLLDGLAEHELIAENAHRLAQRLADDRLAASGDQALHHAGRVRLPPLAPIEDVSGQHQTPGRGIDEQRVRMAEMARPVAQADRAGDQPVRGGSVGDAQQRLGQAQQKHPLLARQPIFMQEGIDTAALRAALPRRLDEAQGQGLDVAAILGTEARLGDQHLDQRPFLGKQRLADRRTAWQLSARPYMAFRLAHDISLTLGP